MVKYTEFLDENRQAILDSVLPHIRVLKPSPYRDDKIVLLALLIDGDEMYLRSVLEDESSIK